MIWLTALFATASVATPAASQEVRIDLEALHYLSAD
jgi:hypothetical protein